VTWSTTTVDSVGSVGLYPSLVLRADDTPFVSYYRRSSGELRVAHLNDNAWEVERVDLTGDVGRHTSIATDHDDKVAVSYEDSSRGTLKYATLNDAGQWTRLTIDSTTSGLGFTSLAFDADNRPAVAYYHASPGDLKFAKFNGTIWRRANLATRGAVGLFPRLYFDDSNRATVLYFDRRVDALQIQIETGSGWTTTRLRDVAGRYVDVAKIPGSTFRIYSFFLNDQRRLAVGELT